MFNDFFKSLREAYKHVNDCFSRYQTNLQRLWRVRGATMPREMTCLGGCVMLVGESEQLAVFVSIFIIIHIKCNKHCIEA